MAFSLKTISAQDRKKILDDARVNPSIRTILEKRRYLWGDNVNLVWAIDNDIDNYLMSCPSPLHEPTSDTHYLFKFDEGMILLRVNGPFGRIAHICNRGSPSFLLQADLKGRIVSAFAQYGRYGKGSAGDLLISDISKEGE